MSQQAQNPANTTATTASAQGEPANILTPASSSPSGTPPPRSSSIVPITALRAEPSQKMEDKPKDNSAAASDRQEAEEPTIASEDVKASALKKNKSSKCIKTKHKQRSKTSKAKSHGKSKKASHDESSSDSSSSEDDSDSDDQDSDDSSSEEELVRKKKARAKQVKKLKEKQRKRRRSKKQESSSESEESESEDSEAVSEEETPRRNKLKKKAKMSEVESDDAGPESEPEKNVNQQINDLMASLAELKATSKQLSKHRRSSSKKVSKSKSAKKGPTADSLAYKRVDQLWDSSIHNYKLKESAEEDESEFGEFAFLVRRKFDWEGKYSSTCVDVKSKLLRDVLSEVMKDCKSVSLETEEPSIDPNLLFLYLEDLRKYYKKTLKKKLATEKKRKNIKKLLQKKSLTKTLCKYIDEDYAATKKELYPLLESGNITFDLLWALFTPNDIAITSCYGVWDEPRCFKVDYAMKYATMTRGEWYCIEGKYMEYDGKAWGYGDFEVDIEAFKGPRKIQSLASYPLKYHSSPDNVKKQIITRGQRFVAMGAQEYKFHKGLAFMKKKKQVLKININGRVMIDPATFRRINPNYPISLIKPDEAEDLFSASDDDDCSCCESEDNDAIGGGHEALVSADADESKEAKFKYKLVKDDRGTKFVAVEVDENGDPVRSQQLDKFQNFGSKKRSYSEEELLLTSPVVLGFAFSEKLWLEFSLSGLHDISYNDQAFSSLVLPGDQKSTVHALVKSHKFHAAKTIDDVVQGKGRGLVFVLHGPPGTGKTLTAEGISELLRCPLYCVSAGELGTDPARLELELQKVLDIAHSWGALLLLDEADVFLEKRQVTDLHRNALVSIFLRLLEYFQGILFLTTNRVETFDDAFQSRIHVALRYDELKPRAKKEVWINFIKMVREQPGGNVAEFSDKDFETLSRHRLNGRQIKNTVRTAQALALNENEELTMTHIKRVLEVAETFDRDLKGGTGYTDAMRSYT